MICNKCGRDDITNKGAFVRHYNSCKKRKNNIKKIYEMYSSGFSINRLKERGYKTSEIDYAIKDIRRNYSDSLKLSHKLCPERFKHSEESKKNLSVKRKRWLKKNRHKHNWRFKKESYPEKLLREWMEKELSDYEIVAEYTPDNFEKNYKLDFAFIKEKKCIEINGNQHYNKDGSFTDYHIQRENYIISKGWKVINIPAINIVKDFNSVKTELLKHFRNNKEISFKKIKTQKEEVKQILEDNYEKIKKMFFEYYNEEKISKLLGIKKSYIINFINEKQIRKLRKEKEIKDREQLILKNIDTTKVGCLNEIGKLLNITSQSAARYVRAHFPTLKLTTLRSKP